MKCRVPFPEEIKEFKKKPKKKKVSKKPKTKTIVKNMTMKNSAFVMIEDVGDDTHSFWEEVDVGDVVSIKIKKKG